MKCKVNQTMKTIEVSRRFIKAASEYGSLEFLTLRAAAANHPTFKITVKSW